MTHLSVRLAGASNPVAAASPGKKTLAVPTQSFEEQLSQAFAETLSKLGIDPHTVKLTVDNASSQTNVTRQNSVTASTPAAVDTAQSADDVYWSKQPSAVQQLRNIEDYYQRSTMGAQLAAEGYSIDTPVMIWGWDASKITQMRQEFGYTWVPSAMQSPISAAPGIGGGAIIPYDPAHPPKGSISV
jgi:hypothetical protein